jgi:hypothetical protein
VRYRLLSEPELSNLLKTTLSGSLQSSKCQQKSQDEPEASDVEFPENLLNEQKPPRLATDKNDNSQNRNNNNLVQT